ncbi:MAG: 9-O-acetylesterase [Phycisphaerae bacterium]|nr:9-O-acetylesterase [Phycisphaerae bacterium]
MHPTLARRPAARIAATFLTLAAGLAHADLSLNGLFGDHMVLQREQPIVVWGQADPGQTVTVTLPGRIGIDQADKDGRWEVRLDAMETGGPHRLAASTSDDSVTLDDVLIGDVWVASGQSNMFWRLEQTDRGPEFMEKADSYENLRLIAIDKTWSNELEADASTKGWTKSTSDAARTFSAVGFQFGRILAEQTDVPIGVIHSSWGGTPAEAWTPMAALEAQPEVFADRLASLKDYNLPEAERERQLADAHEKHAAFAKKAWAEDIGVDAGWADPSFDDSSWGTMEMPGYIAGALGSFDGIVWLRREIDLSAASEGEPGMLRLKRIDEYDKAYINGVQVGETVVEDGDGRNIERAYEIPKGVLRAGRNVVAVRLMNVRGSGGIVTDQRRFRVETDHERAELEGEWKYQVGFDARDHGGFPRPAAYAIPVGRPYRGPAALYNAMIHPLTKLGVKGAIWYQGESNSGRGDEYAELFPAMIQGWRDAWAEARGENVKLPFYFVQLPNYRERAEEPGESSWADLREAQRRTLEKLPDTGMAITIDIGDPTDIHPTNKLPVAERLASVAMADLYGADPTNASGPLPKDVRRGRNGSVRVRFEQADGLRTSDGGDRVAGFAVAGDDGVFHWADAKLENNAVVVRADEVSRPTRIRYLWADNPETNLVNAAGLPATPFQAEID